MSARRANRLLSVKVTNNVLTIEIGVEALTHAFRYSPYVDRVVAEYGSDLAKPDVKIAARDFANDVVDALKEEAEDGSTLVHRMLDAACEVAVEQGSEHFDVVEGA